MLSTEKWDNCEKSGLLVRFTGLTRQVFALFRQVVTNLLAQSVDKIGSGRSFITPGIRYVMIITFHCQGDRFFILIL